MQREFLRQQHRRKVRKITYGVVALLIIIFCILLFRAQRPLSRAKGQSITIAKKAGIQNVDKFYTSELNRTYYTVQGTNNHNSNLYVIISKDNGSTTVLNASQGINQTDAINQVKSADKVKKILNAAPSLFNNKPVWIVSYLNQSNKLCYYTLNYSNGRAIQTITNV